MTSLSSIPEQKFRLEIFNPGINMMSIFSAEETDLRSAEKILVKI